MSSPIAPILRVCELSKAYPAHHRGQQRTQALDRVSLDVRPGETVGIVGESGSGKSTLARILTRLTPADSGSVTYREVDLLHADRKQARYLTSELQIVFQDPNSAMNPRHTVRKALSEAVRASGREQILDADLVALLRLVGVSEMKLSAYPHELSGGQRQRVAIARALAVDPSVIIADECVSALDVSVQSTILNLMLKLQQEKGLSYLFISHDLAVVHQMSDRIVVMKDGRVVESGHADEVMTEPKDPYTRQLLAGLPGVEA